MRTSASPSRRRSRRRRRSDRTPMDRTRRPAQAGLCVCGAGKGGACCQAGFRDAPTCVVRRLDVGRRGADGSVPASACLVGGRSRPTAMPMACWSRRRGWRSRLWPLLRTMDQGNARAARCPLRDAGPGCRWCRSCASVCLVGGRLRPTAMSRVCWSRRRGWRSRLWPLLQEMDQGNARAARCPLPAARDAGPGSGWGCYCERVCLVGGRLRPTAMSMVCWSRRRGWRSRLWPLLRAMDQGSGCSPRRIGYGLTAAPSHQCRSGPSTKMAKCRCGASALALPVEPT